MESDIAKHKPPLPKHDNLKPSERSALHSLKKKEDIIIKPADKGSAVVVMDREHYISEAERQLNDSTYYKALDHDPTHEFAKKVADAVSEMLNGDHISEKNAIYLTVDQPKAGRFYLLPKIHKAENPGRPIVSANGHPTEKNIRICGLTSSAPCAELTILLAGYHRLPEKTRCYGPTPT